MGIIWIKRFIGALIAFHAAFFLSPALALELYQAEVPVSGQGNDERLKAYPAALAQVVVKLTGDQSVPALPRLARFMGSAGSLVQQYSYQELPPASSALSEAGFKRLLVVRFDREAVTKALIAAEVPLWSRTRPETLVWLAVEDGASRYLLAASGMAELEASLNGHAQRRGLPLLLPLLDIDDQRKLSFADVWGDFRQPILNASQRYGVNAVLVGRLTRGAQGGWQGRWSLHQLAGESEQWQAAGASADAAIASGIDAAADRSARRYAQLFSSASAGFVNLAVTQVTDTAAYARTLRYLQGLDIVSGVQVSRLRADELLLRVAIRGDVNGLTRTLGLGKTLLSTGERVELADAEAVAGEVLIYQLAP